MVKPFIHEIYRLNIDIDVVIAKGRNAWVREFLGVNDLVKHIPRLISAERPNIHGSLNCLFSRLQTSHF